MLFIMFDIEIIFLYPSKELDEAVAGLLTTFILAAAVGVAIALIMGFFVALFVAWVYELTPEGIKRESEVDRSKSISARTGQKLNIVIIVASIALLKVTRRNARTIGV